MSNQVPHFSKVVPTSGVVSDFDVIKSNDSYKMQVEWAGGFPFLHIDVYKTAPSTIKDIKKDFNKLMKKLRGRGHPAIFMYNMNVRFSKLIHKTELLATFDYQGESREIYMVEL